MQFSFATFLACAAVLTAAQEHDHSAYHEREHWILKKDITCPTAGGTATFSYPCHTGPPTASASHPHSRPASDLTHTRSMRWDGTVTVYPSGAPETTVTRDVDCQGETGPSCSYISFATRTCSDLPHESGKYHNTEKAHKSFPTVTASAGATKTVHAKHTATCKAASSGIA